MGNDQNPYQAYTDGSLFSGNPLDLVIALYQGAVDATNQAENALRAGDISSRTRAINKAISILTELIVSLDVEKGGEIALNLKGLYGYMQQRLLNAHFQQAAEPIVEVRKLLETLLDGWRGAGSQQVSQPSYLPKQAESSAPKQNAASAYASAPVYGGYGDDLGGSLAGSAYSF